LKTITLLGTRKPISIGGRGGEMTQALYAHMNNKTKQKKPKTYQHT
jgi:hypothetical protein